MSFAEQSHQHGDTDSDDCRTVEGLLDLIAARIRQGRVVTIKHSKLLYWEISPSTSKELRLRLKSGKLELLEWLLDNILGDMSKWNREVGIGVYALSEPRVYNPYNSDERGFRVSGHYYLRMSNGEYQQVQNHATWQGIQIIVAPLMETRTDVAISCAGPETIPTLWYAYDHIVSEIQAHKLELDDKVRDTTPLCEVNLQIPTYVYRRKPSPEIAKRNQSILIQATEGVTHKELAKKHNLSKNTIKSIVHMERRSRQRLVG
jgi:hypothetical protein